MEKRALLIENLLKQTDTLLTEELVLGRGAFLSRPGTPERFIYRLEQGAIRVFRTLESGEEQTIRFAYAGDLFSSLPAFFDTSPGLFYMQALRKTILRRSPKSAFFREVESDIALLQGYRYLLEDLFRQQLERELDLLTQSPAERYARVLARSPRLFHEVPAKYIASYLRMTPETLSRIQRKSESLS